jgi:hypothetical protein
MASGTFREERVPDRSPWLPIEGRRLVNFPGVTSLVGSIAIATTMCLTVVFLRDPLGVIGWLLASR